MYKKQCGAVLVVSLIILFSVTLLVFSGNKSVLMQEKMAMAVRDAHVALQMSESGIRDAEKLIETYVSTVAFNVQGTGGLYSQDNGPSNIFDTNAWLSSNTIDASTQVSESGRVASYFIEHLGLLSVPNANLDALNINGYGQTSGGGDVNIFKIVSRSQGDNGDAERVVVSYYGKRF
ncbi:pilus assembly PilX family protein [Psychromonas hadalis]|uniref:pilus assembly PilX family protein n=1 Tax=Psychromonas hadalis TaxID=211669 RepID=UPI0003B32FC6|nr:PilX N-terminal domain-containing pilus assembly protein [Psychromonas hadalis]